MKKGIVFLIVLTVLLGLSACASAAVMRLPASIRSIEMEAFYGDTKLDQVVLPEGLTSIYEKAFANTTVKKINLPESLTFIDSTAFDGVSSLVIAAVPASYGYAWAEARGYAIEDQFPTLVRGAKGERVRLVQEYLIALGYYTGEANGIFDLPTKNAVKQLQQDHNLSMTGQVNLSTWNMIKQLYLEISVVILSQPADCRVGAYATASFSVETENATGYQWETSYDQGATWQPLTNSTFWHGNKTDTLSFDALPRYNGYWFRVIVKGAGGPITSDPAVLTVLRTPAILRNPANQSAVAGESVMFSVTTFGASSYQWQIGTDHYDWQPLSDDAFLTGSTTDTLTFTAMEKYDGYYFRVRVTGWNDLYEQDIAIYSDVALFTMILPLPAPTSISATALSTSEIRLSWDYSGDAEGFYIRISSENSAPRIYAKTGAGTRSITVNGLDPKTRYFLSVSAYSAGIESEPVAVSAITF